MKSSRNQLLRAAQNLRSSRKSSSKRSLRKLVVESLETRRLLTVSMPELLSLNALETGTPDGTSSYAEQSLSADGRFHVFSSSASDIVNDDLNGTWDIFLRDLELGTVTLVSRNALGGTGNSYSDQAVISASGEYVAFMSYASDLDVTGPNSENGQSQIYRWHRPTGALSLVSLNSDEDGGGNNASSTPSISHDGQRIAYASHADNLVSGLTDINGAVDVYLANLSGPVQTLLVSRSSQSPLQTANGWTDNHQISRDGNRVVYRSGATDVESGVNDVNGMGADLIVFDVSSQSNRYVTLESSAATTGNADSWRTQQSLSADGRYEVFASNASDLVNGDANGVSDVFLRDLQTGEITLISQSDVGGTANSSSDQAVISADGNYVAFSSYASNLDVVGPNSDNGWAQLYRWHRATGERILISVNATDDNGGDANSSEPSISQDGQRIAFHTVATDLVSGITDVNGGGWWDTYYYRDVYVRDYSVEVPVTTLLSHSVVDPFTTGDSYSYAPRISQDGSRVVYRSAATDLESGVTDLNVTGEDLIVYDLAAGTNAYVVLQASAPSTGNSGSSRTSQSLSADGRYEVFTSNASDLVGGDTNGFQDVFLRDLQTGVTSLVSRRPDGMSANGHSVEAVISADGEYVAFYSYASNLDVTGTNASSGYYAQVFRWHRVSGEIVLVSVNASNDDGGNYESYGATISGDGQRIAFHSTATNLVAGVTDTNGGYYYYSHDVYLRDFTTESPTTRLVSHTATDALVTGNGYSIYPQISRDGARIVYRTQSTDMESNVTDTNAYQEDLVVYDIDAESNAYVSVQTETPTSGNNGSSKTQQSLSADGRYEVFESDASDLVEGDENVSRDVFLRDLQTGEVTLISRRADGKSANSSSRQAIISADGEYVAFHSNATDLEVSGVNSTFGNTQVYRWHRLTGEIVLISVNATEDDAAAQDSFVSSISGDGQKVAFDSYASDLIVGVTDTNGTWSFDVYVRDLSGAIPTTHLISRSAADPLVTGDSYAFSGQLSRDGSVVVFLSAATDMATGVLDGNGYDLDLFQYHFSSGEVNAVNVTPDGSATGNWGVQANFSISENGLVIAFSSTATDLHPMDLDGSLDVFVRDDSVPFTGLELVSVNSDGSVKGDWHSNNPSVSGSGQWVAFESEASNLDPLQSQYQINIYVRDRGLGSEATTLISINADGTSGGDSGSYMPRISFDGSVVAFESYSTDLDSSVTDSNSGIDVFVRDWQSETPQTRLVSARDAALESGDYGSWQPELSDDGGRLVFVTYATNLLDGIPDVNSTSNDLFAFDGVGLTLVTQKGSGRYTGRTGVATIFDLSDDGMQIAYTTDAVGIVADTAYGSNVYVRDFSTFTSGLTERVSVDNDGIAGNSHASHPSLSGDGRYVAFSTASNFTPEDTNWWEDIYVRDRTAGVTSLISINSAGTQSADSSSHEPQISHDGSVVAFLSYASDLDGSIADTNGVFDVFVRDWQAVTPLTQLVSRRDASSESGDAASTKAELSDDGGRVIFSTEATNLTSAFADVNLGSQDIFAFDGTSVSLVTRKATGKFTGNVGVELGFDVSDDGLNIAFSSGATGILAEIVGGTHVYVSDFTVPGNVTFERISVDNLGEPGNGSSYNPSISGDGRFVAFESAANLDPLDTNWWNPWDIYVRDRQLAQTTLVSVNSDASASGDNSSNSPRISRDGSTIAFISYASDLDADVSDANGVNDAFIRNWQSPLPVTRMVSRSATSPTSGNGGSTLVELSQDGSRMVFTTQAYDLTSDYVDVNAAGNDIFSFDGLVSSLVSYKGSGKYTSGQAVDYYYDVNDDGSRIAFVSSAVGIVADSAAGTHVYVRDLSDLANGTTARASVDNDGIAGIGGSYRPSISGDGRYVAFESQAILDPLDTDPWWWNSHDIYVRDMVDNQTVLVSVNAENTNSGDNYSYAPRLSRDGSTVVFTSYATNLVSGITDSNGTLDTFLRKWRAPSPVTDLLSPSFAGDSTSNNESNNPLISENGITAIFLSYGDDLTSLNDSNGTYDIFGIRAAAISLVPEDADKLESDDGSQAYTFTVKREWFIGSAFTVAWKVVPSGSNPVNASDFGGAFPEGSVQFEIGDLEKTISVMVQGEFDVEEDEGFTVVLFDSTNNSQIVQESANGTILNNDIDLVISANQASLVEGNSGTSAFSFTVTRIGYTGIPTTVNWSTTGVTSSPANAADFGGVFPSGAIGFAIGETQQQIQVNASGDSLVERNEVFRVTLSNPSPNAQVHVATADSTILNDDAASIALVGISANEATGKLDFTVTISNPVDTAVTVDFKTLGTGTALAATDFTVIASQIVTFAAGSTTTQTVSVTVTDENLVELDETVQANIAGLSAAGRNVSIGGANATGTILNDDAASIALVGISANEATGKLDFTVTISNPVDTAVTVDFKTLGTGTALAATDFTAIASQIVTFAAGSTTTQTVSVTVTDENLVELDETVQANIAGLSAAGRNVSIGGANATGTILNDDAASIALVGISANEATGKLDFTVTINNPVDTAVTVDFKTLGTGTALAATDFTAIASQLVTFAAGSTTTQTVSVTVTDENLVELDETVQANIAGLSAAGRNVSIGVANATGTILNDDAASIALVGISANEATGKLDFTVTISNPVDTAVTVDFKTLDTGTALAATDFTAIASQLVTFAAGSTTTQTVSVTVTDENLVELDETVQANIAGLSAAGRNVSIGVANATGTILNDDAASIALVGISANEATGKLDFTVTISNPVDTAVTVDFKTLGTGTATAGVDFTSISGQTVTFLAGSTTTQTVSVTVLDDLWVEPNETVNAELLNLATSGRFVTTSVPTAVGTILNDDVVTVVNRRVFYNNSGYETAGGVSAALDTSKTLLRATGVSQATTSANVINYSRGINGIVLDVAGMPATSLAASDFVFRVAPSSAGGVVNPSAWGLAPTPTVIHVTPGTATTPARVRLEWTDNAIQNTWLQIIVLSNANTGLVNREVYYLGHALGDADLISPTYRVTTNDVAIVRAAVNSTPVSVSDPRDVDKDRRVTTNDVAFVRARVSSDALLRTITVPAAGSGAEGEGLTEGSMVGTLDGATPFERLVQIVPMEFKVRSAETDAPRRVLPRFTNRDYAVKLSIPSGDRSLEEFDLHAIASDAVGRKGSPNNGLETQSLEAYFAEYEQGVAGIANR
jgi:hypothetical protein